MGKRKSASPDKQKQQGNYIDNFFKRMFGKIFLFVDFLLSYADPEFVAEIDLNKIQPARTHYFGTLADERIADLIFTCPLKCGDGSLMAVILFEHESKSLKEIPLKLLRYISAIWDAELKEGKPLPAPYFIILRTGKKPHRGQLPTMATLLPKRSDGTPLGHVPEFKYVVVDLPSKKLDELVGGAVLRSVLGVLLTMTGDTMDDFPKALLPLLELPEGERTGWSNELLDFVLKAYVAHNRPLDREGLSKALHPVFKGKEKAMIKTIFEECAAGAKAELGREMVLEALQTKFKKIPKTVEKAVLAMSDPIALKSLLAQAIESETMDEFAEALR